jgi:hypothetical protein
MAAPEDPHPAVVAVSEPRANRRQSLPCVTQRQPRPFRQVPVAGRAVPGQIAVRQQRQRPLALKWRRRRPEPIPDQRERWLRAMHRAAHDQAAHGGKRQQVNHRLPLRAHPGTGHPVPELCPGERAISGQRTLDDHDAPFGVPGRHAFLGEPPRVPRHQLRGGQRVQPPVVLGRHQVQSATVEPADHV